MLAIQRVNNALANELSVNFDQLPRLASEWTLADALIFARFSARDGVTPMERIPVELQTSQVWAVAFARHPELYHNTIPSDIATYDFYLRACDTHFRTSNLEFIPDEMRTPQLYLTCARSLEKRRGLDGRCNFLALVPARCQSSELVNLVIKEDPENLEFVANQTIELCETVLTEDPHYIWMIRDQTPELCKFAITKAIETNKNYYFRQTIQSIRLQHEPFYISVLKSLDWEFAEDFLRYSNVQTRAVCMVAYDLDDDCIGVIRSPEIRRWLMRVVITRNVLPMLGVGLSTALLTEIYDPLQDYLFPMDASRYTEVKLSPILLWNLLTFIKRASPASS